jgi:hypothetical protein
MKRGPFALVAVVQTVSPLRTDAGDGGQPADAGGLAAE